MPKLYILHPGGEFDPCEAWVGEAWAVVSAEAAHAGWEIAHLKPADPNRKFDPLAAYSVIARSIGPVLLVGQLSTPCVATLESKLCQQAVMQWRPDVGDSTAIYEAMLDLIQRHNIGEPEISQRLGVSVLLVAKLERMHYWGGNAKGYMSVQKLAKSNGLDEKFKSVASDIAHYLSAEKREIRLLSSKLGDGYPKYACNNDDRQNVYAFLRDWKVDDVQLMNWLTRDTAKMSVRELDAVKAVNYDKAR